MKVLISDEKFFEKYIYMAKMGIWIIKMIIY